MTGDEALKMALIAHYEEYYSQYDVPADEKPHRFSLAYRIRKNSIIRLAKKRWERDPRHVFRVSRRESSLPKGTIFR